MCRAEAPHLSRLQEKYKDQGLTVLGVNADNNSKENLNRFIQEKKLTHAILLNGSGVAMQAYSARAYPTTYWIDRSGKLVAREYGYHGPEKLERTAQKLLKQKRPRATP